MLANKEEYGTDSTKYEKEEGREELGSNIKEIFTQRSSYLINGQRLTCSFLLHVRLADPMQPVPAVTICTNS